MPISEVAHPDTWMPFYIGDYVGATMHLSTEEHGAYFLLICAYWKNGGPLPDDDKELSQITKFGSRKWTRVRQTLQKFFTISDGLWRHTRVDKEIANAIENIEARRARTAAATEARRQRNDDRNDQRNDAPDGVPKRSVTSTPSPSPSPVENTPPISPPPQPKPPNGGGVDPLPLFAKLPKNGAGAIYPQAFNDWWALYPPTPNNSKKVAYQRFRAAVKNGTNLENLNTGVKNYAAYCESTSCLVAHASTWLNGERWDSDYTIRNTGQPNAGTGGQRSSGVVAAGARAAARLRE